VARLLVEQRQDDELQILAGELAPAAHAAPAFHEPADLGEPMVTAVPPHVAVMVVVLVLIAMPEPSKVTTHDISFFMLNDIS
jgi:hypothetical protein